MIDLGTAEDNPYTLAISRDRDGTTIMITGDGVLTLADTDVRACHGQIVLCGTTLHRFAMQANDEGNVCRG